jgi:hypothetical protein
MGDEEISAEECRLYAQAWVLDLLEGNLSDKELHTLFICWDFSQYTDSSDT